MTRVTIVIPAHNSEPYLAETLRSVEAQTYSDWEIVAVDDGSTDETWNLLQAAGPRVRALRNATPAGPAAARNQALEHASGELVAFLDADDLLAPDYLESQVTCLEAARARGRRVGLVACDARLLDDDGYAGHTYLDTVRHRDGPLTLEVVLQRNPIYISALVPAEVGRAVGWFDRDLFGTEDFGLWVKILEAGYDAVLNPRPLAVYRRRTGSISSNIARQGINNRRVYEQALARGRLTPRQRRIARQAIRYNRAMEAVARLRFAPGGERRAGEIVRLAPLLAWVAVTNPRWWGQWLAILRTGRQPPAPGRRPRAPRPPAEGARATVGEPRLNGDITVVISCFNYGAYLPEAVDSALHQEGGAPRVIVVDDGSTDPATLRALEDLPDEVTLIRQPNGGLAAARNTGLGAADTPYLIVLDADDRLVPDALATLRRPLDRDPGLGFAYGVARFFGAWEGEMRFPPYDPYKLLFRHIIGSTALMRRELFDQVGGFDPAFSAYEDWEFWLHALARGWRGEHVGEVTLMYRRHGTTTMNFDARAAYRMWFRRLRTKHPELYARAGRRRLAADSGLGPLGRAVYRWWWGARPLPARAEAALQALLWRPGRRERVVNPVPQR